MKAKIPKKEIGANRDREMNHAMELSELKRQERYFKGSNQHVVAGLRVVEANHALIQSRITRIETAITRARELKNKNRVLELEAGLKLMKIKEKKAAQKVKQTQERVTRMLSDPA